MKRKISLIFAAVMLTALLTIGTTLTFAADPAEKDLLKTPSDWALFNDKCEVSFNSENELKITPTGTFSAGAAYTKLKLGSGTFNFDYRLDYYPGVEPYSENQAVLSECFFGLMFMHNVTVNTVTSELVYPWGVKNGYPYMVAFDTEQGLDPDAQRATQLGLTLRRYPFDGDHAYTRWSTVNPSNESLYNDKGRQYDSKIPDFYKAVPVSKAFDGNAHNVKVEFIPMSKAKGDDKDCMRITVWFDGEKSLEVFDEMPFKGEYLGDEEDVDKREKDGYFSFFSYHDGSAMKELPNFDVIVEKASVVAGPSNETGVVPGDNKGGGCGGSVHAEFGIVFAFMVAGCGVLLLSKRKFKSEK